MLRYEYIATAAACSGPVDRQLWIMNQGGVRRALPFPTELLATNGFWGWGPGAGGGRLGTDVITITSHVQSFQVVLSCCFQLTLEERSGSVGVESMYEGLCWDGVTHACVPSALGR